VSVNTSPTSQTPCGAGQRQQNNSPTLAHHFRCRVVLLVNSQHTGAVLQLKGFSILTQGRPEHRTIYINKTCTAFLVGEIRTRVCRGGHCFVPAETQASYYMYNFIFELIPAISVKFIWVSIRCWGMHRAGQSCAHTPYMTVCMVIFLLKTVYKQYIGRCAWFWPNLRRVLCVRMPLQISSSANHHVN
jgi:hypothetical protein